MPAPTSTAAAELASQLRPSLLRLLRLIRQQRVDETLTLSQVSALGSLDKHGPLTPGELAAIERVQPPSLTKVVAGLEDRGLVTRAAHPTDRRQAILTLTEAAEQLLESERRSRDAWLAQRLATLEPAERRLLEQAIPVLDRLADG